MDDMIRRCPVCDGHGYLNVAREEGKRDLGITPPRSEAVEESGTSPATVEAASPSSGDGR